METVKGKYGCAHIFTDDIEESAVNQIRNIMNDPVSEGSKVRVMPDVHPGKVGPIGLTMTVGDRVMPSLLGIDIGCGMLMAKVKTKTVEFTKLDKAIRKKIPAGFDIRTEPHTLADIDLMTKLYCVEHIDIDKCMRAIGTLGGGNHFIEMDKGSDSTYIIIHSGSRRLGKEVTEYYMNKGRKDGVPYELTYLDGDLMKMYLHDVSVVQKYASLNRKAMLQTILKEMKWKAEEEFESIHNYIDESMILRKGSISAGDGETVIIPINMRDGVIIGRGKGNPEWNYSAPHGSGRKLRRDMVKSVYTVSAFKKDMEGIYCTSISKETLDEAPAAYRTIDEISERISETVEITDILKPIYNFKAEES